MDIAFARWMTGRALLTYKARDGQGFVQVIDFDALSPEAGSKQLTGDAACKIDPYSWLHKGRKFLLPGIDGKATGHVYLRNAGAESFRLIDTIALPRSTLDKLGLLQSIGPFEFNGKVYAVYQVNIQRRKAGGFWEITFRQPGKIWRTTFLESPAQQWKLTAMPDVLLAEPEPYVASIKVWAFYCLPPSGGVLRLYRAETPLEQVK